MGDADEPFAKALRAGAENADKEVRMTGIVGGEDAAWSLFVMGAALSGGEEDLDADRRGERGF